MLAPFKPAKVKFEFLMNASRLLSCHVIFENIIKKTEYIFSSWGYLGKTTFPITKKRKLPNQSQNKNHHR